MKYYYYNAFMPSEMLDGYFSNVEFDIVGFSEESFTADQIEDEMQYYAHEYGLTEAQARECFDVIVVDADTRSRIWERWMERGE